MRVLCACEESQNVCLAFKDLYPSWDVFSCDIQPCSGGHPELHLQCDVRDVLFSSWDLVIAFPPCTYLTKASATRLFPGGVLDVSRYNKGLAAREFFMMFYNLDVPHLAIENPTPLSIFNLPPKSDTIQPFYFGHPFSKRTCLWLKNLPPLMPTEIVLNPEPTSTAAWFQRGSNRQVNRSKTFSGVAHAMASQWGSYIMR